MSQFTIGDLVDCPACGAAVTFDLVHSVNADRAPALRKAILDEQFQRDRPARSAAALSGSSPISTTSSTTATSGSRPCRSSGWPRWREDEAEAEALFERIYGPRSSPLIQSIGKRIDERLAFGWAAVREKLLIADLGLDDVTVELVKSAVLRASTSAPVGLGAEMRLVGADDTSCTSPGWHSDRTRAWPKTIGVSRKLYDQIAADEDGDWQSLRAQIAEGMFVDLGRLLVPAARDARGGGRLARAAPAACRFARARSQAEPDDGRDHEQRAGDLRAARSPGRGSARRAPARTPARRS